jgi:hypothetical protein
MEECVKLGLTKSIGLSNFNSQQIQRILDNATIKPVVNQVYKRVICKVRGLTLLLQVGTLWKCSDGFFFEVSPLASDALLTTLHPLLENVLQNVDHFEISCLGAPLFMVRNDQKSHGARSGLYGGCSNGVPPIHFFQAENRIQFTSRPMRFLVFSNHKKRAPRKGILK